MLMQIPSLPEKVDRENNKDYNQVLLDVQRSLRRFPPGELIPVQSSVFCEALLFLRSYMPNHFTSVKRQVRELAMNVASVTL